LGYRFLILCSAIAVTGAAVNPLAESVTRKLDLIQSERARPGAVFVFTEAELNAWVRVKVPTVVPEGVREPRLELGNGAATGFALVNFLKVQHAAGIETNWLVSKLIQGEKPVMAKATIQSANGSATVHLERVEIGGLAISGATLDFLIDTFFRPLYPEAKIDEPFELAGHVDRIEIAPAAAKVYIKK
jgi:hypothetical protein